MEGKKKKIAIIGGGYRGIACLKELLDRGYEVHLYEKNNDIGGTWHSDNLYDGLKTHTSAFTNQFPNFPYPKEINIYERLSGIDAYKYLRYYCEYYNLFKSIRLNAQISKILYNSKLKKCTLIINESQSEEYDYIVNTNGFSDKTIPNFKGEKEFLGKIIHSFDANTAFIEYIISNNKKVVILGGSKTAGDIIISFYKHAYKNIKWLYRKSYWFFCYDFIYNARTSVAGRIKGLFLQNFIIFYFFCFAYHPLIINITCAIARFIGLIETYGVKHSDYKKFHFGIFDRKELDMLKECNDKYSKTGDIKQFDRNGIFLTDGTYIEADVVICCTGSSGGMSLIEMEVDGKTF
jgi:hypothetical protein